MYRSWFMSKRWVLVMILTLLVSAFSLTMINIIEKNKNSNAYADPPSAKSYHITDIDSWNAFANSPNSKTVGAYLDNDIDFGGATINCVSTFSKKFYGCGYTLSNFVVEGLGVKRSSSSTLLDYTEINTSYMGLFSSLTSDASIMNLKIKNATIKFKGNFNGNNDWLVTRYNYFVGGCIAGFSEGATISKCCVENCTINLTVADVTATANSGLTGDLNEVTKKSLGSWRGYNYCYVAGIVGCGNANIVDCCANNNSFKTNLNKSSSTDNYAYVSSLEHRTIGPCLCSGYRVILPDCTGTVNRCVAKPYFAVKYSEDSNFISNNSSISGMGSNLISNCITESTQVSSLGDNVSSDLREERKKTWYYGGSSYNDGWPYLTDFVGELISVLPLSSGSGTYSYYYNKSEIMEKHQESIFELYDLYYYPKYNTNGTTINVPFTEESGLSDINVTSKKVTFFEQSFTFESTSNGYYSGLSVNRFDDNGTIYLTVNFSSSYTLTYETNGGDPIVPSFCVYGQEIELPTASKKGYELDSWYHKVKKPFLIFWETEVDETIGPAGTSYTVTKSETIYASWEANTYYVQYNANGGTGTMSNSEHTYDTSKELTKNTFAKNGYEFKGWSYTSGKNNNVNFTDEQSVKNLTDKDGQTIQLYAVWVPVEYGIIYHLDGGINNSNNPTKYTIETETITLLNPSKKYFDFVDWYIDENLEVAGKTIGKGSTGVKEFYAKWESHTYSLTYDLNDQNTGTDGKIISKATNATTNVALYEYSETKSFTFADPIRAGYKFDGWQIASLEINTEHNDSSVEIKKEDGSNYIEEDMIDVIYPYSYGNITVKATWSPIEYTVTYVLNDTEDYPANEYIAVRNSEEHLDQSFFTIETPAFNLNSPSRDFYSFVKWYSDPNLTDSSKIVSSIAQRTKENVVLYAKWEYEKWYVTINKGTYFDSEETAAINVSDNVNSVVSAQNEQDRFITESDGNYTISMKTYDVVKFVCDYENNEYSIVIKKGSTEYRFTYNMHSDEYGQDGYVYYNDPLWKYTIERGGENGHEQIGAFEEVSNTNGTEYELTLDKSLNYLSTILPENILFSFTPNFVLKVYNNG